MCLNMGYNNSLEDDGVTAFCENTEAKYIELLPVLQRSVFCKAFQCILSNPFYQGQVGWGLVELELDDL